MEATLLLINETHWENGTHWENRSSYGSAHSGVIFREDEDCFYFLTALHALETRGEEEDLYRVLGYGDLAIGEYVEKTNELPSGGLSVFYTRYPLARLEYSDEAYDLAIMSFASEGNFSSPPLTRRALKAGDPIVSIGIPQGKRNLVTYGRIKSLAPRYFKDGPSSPQHPIIQHTAYGIPGCSGGPILNAWGEIAGITLGGGESFRHFRHGLMIPADRIHQFISDWAASP